MKSLHQAALPPPMVHILILAAGASARMRGADKLLELVEGQPLLRHLAQVASGVGLPVAIALPPSGAALYAARVAVLADMPHLTLVEVPRAAEGMGESLRASVATLPSDVAILLMLADMPEIMAQDIEALLAAYQAEPRFVWRAITQEGWPGHPVLFPAKMRAGLLDLMGDQGARDLISEAHRLGLVGEVRLSGGRARCDLDTPEDWAIWRGARPA